MLIICVRSTALQLLTPRINLASTQANGQSILAQLPLADASFVNGVFANDSQEPPSINHTIAYTPDVGADWILTAEDFSFHPAIPIATGVWSVLLLSISGWEMFGRLRVRCEHRKRLQAGLGQGWEMVKHER